MSHCQYVRDGVVCGAPSYSTPCGACQAWIRDLAEVEQPASPEETATTMAPGTPEEDQQAALDALEAACDLMGQLAPFDQLRYALGFKAAIQEAVDAQQASPTNIMAPITSQQNTADAPAPEPNPEPAPSPDTPQP